MDTFIIMIIISDHDTHDNIVQFTHNAMNVAPHVPNHPGHGLQVQM